MEKLNKISLPATILIASLILGGFYYASEVSKQKSIERQQKIKIEQENKIQFEKNTQEAISQTESKEALDTCLSGAEKEAERLNQALVDYGKSKDYKGIDLSGAFADVKTQLEKDKSECFKKFPQ